MNWQKRNISLEGMDAAVGRCGGMGPTTGGTFAIKNTFYCSTA